MERKSRASNSSRHSASWSTFWRHKQQESERMRKLEAHTAQLALSSHRLIVMAITWKRAKLFSTLLRLPAAVVSSDDCCRLRDWEKSQQARESASVATKWTDLHRESAMQSGAVYCFLCLSLSLSLLLLLRVCTSLNSRSHSIKRAAHTQRLSNPLLPVCFVFRFVLFLSLSCWLSFCSRCVLTTTTTTATMKANLAQSTHTQSTTFTFGSLTLLAWKHSLCSYCCLCVYLNEEDASLLVSRFFLFYDSFRANNTHLQSACFVCVLVSLWRRAKDEMLYHLLNLFLSLSLARASSSERDKHTYFCLSQASSSSSSCSLCKLSLFVCVWAVRAHK